LEVCLAAEIGFIWQILNKSLLLTDPQNFDNYLSSHAGHSLIWIGYISPQECSFRVHPESKMEDSMLHWESLNNILESWFFLPRNVELKGIGVLCRLPFLPLQVVENPHALSRARMPHKS
jgi:hypothetical protein